MKYPNVHFKIIFLFLFTTIIIILFSIPYLSLLKPKCCVCGETLWQKGYQNGELRACDICYHKAQNYAIEELCYKFIYESGLPGYMVDQALVDRTWGIIKERQ